MKNKYKDVKEKKEKQLLKEFTKFFAENDIKRYEDLPNAGAYIVFNHLKDKVKCYNDF